MKNEQEKLTPLVAQNTDTPPTGFNWDNFDMDKFFKEADEVGRIRTGVQPNNAHDLGTPAVPGYTTTNANTVEAKSLSEFPTNCTCHTPTPTVKEAVLVVRDIAYKNRQEAFEAGRLKGIEEELNRTLYREKHEQRKLLDGFAHPSDCKECGSALAAIKNKK